MRAATVKAAIPAFFDFKNSVVAAAKEEAECPEGNEVSCGIEISKSISAPVKGRGRKKIGLIILLHKTVAIIKATATVIPQERVLGKHSKRITTAIQMIPKLQAKEKNFIIGVSQSHTI